MSSLFQNTVFQRRNYALIRRNFCVDGGESVGDRGEFLDGLCGFFGDQLVDSFDFFAVLDVVFLRLVDELHQQRPHVDRRRWLSG